MKMTLRQIVDFLQRAFRVLVHGGKDDPEFEAYPSGFQGGTIPETFSQPKDETTKP